MIATADGAGRSPAIGSSLRAALRRLGASGGLELLREISFTLVAGRPHALSALPNGMALSLLLCPNAGDPRCDSARPRPPERLRIRLRLGSASALYDASAGAPLIVGGPSHRNGRLFLVLEVGGT